MSDTKNHVVTKVVRNGKVAVLYSPDYGAGWSTWTSEHAEFALFDSGLVWLAESKATQKDVDKYIKEALGDAYFFTGGWRDIEIEWIPVGTMFKVDEYDGNESIHTLGSISFHVA